MAKKHTITEASVKADTGKANLTLVPYDSLTGVAKVFEYGAKKYEKWSWAQHYSEDTLERYIAAIIRHAYAMSQGELLDDESGLPHADHITAGGMIVSSLQKKLATGKSEEDKPEEPVDRSEG